MTNKRLQITSEIKRQVLHETGYKCANPACRTILTIDIHHLDYISEGGSNQSANLLALCPNCHTLHHKGHIPKESLRSWKMLILSLNEGFDKRSIDMLLALDKVERLMVSGEGVLGCAALIATELVEIDTDSKIERATGSRGFLFSGLSEYYQEWYWVKLSEKGSSLVKAWKRGDQQGAVTGKAFFADDAKKNNSKKST